MFDYGSGWVGPGLIGGGGDRPIQVLIFWGSIPCVFCLNTLLKVVSDGFQKKVRVGGWGEHYLVLFWIFYFAKPLST